MNTKQLVRKAYYICEEGTVHQIVQVTNVTAHSVSIKIINNTMNHPGPFLVGTTHEITKRTFLALFTPYPKIKGMLLDGVNNE